MSANDEITEARVAQARLQAEIAELEAKKAEADARKRLAEERAGAQIAKERESVTSSAMMRHLRMIAMVGGLMLSGGGVADERNDWLPGADGTALVAIGATSLVGAALGGSKKKENKEDDDD
jgi:septal ring factor EnvC (AmiA/AmiB activator)